jgi:hypothetical protein
MNEHDLTATWKSLDPNEATSRRVRTTLEAWLEAHDTSLVAEWVGLFKRDPMVGVGLTAVSGLALGLVSPLAWLLVG